MKNEMLDILRASGEVEVSSLSTFFTPHRQTISAQEEYEHKLFDLNLLYEH